MNRLACFLLIFLLTACDYFEKQKVNTEDLLEEELQTFNWNDVDTYPTFNSCEAMTTKEDSRVCFQNTLLQHVNDYLGSQNIVVSEDVYDTIRLKLIIDNKGLLQIEDIALHPETEYQIPEIDSLLRQSLKDVPKIFPAIKRGQQVTTVFELPVIVRID
ncbi:hypothetical protein [Winogradskyella marincola]|uniref:TonB C-terminal domain-containing protein n=1 Tax=Winogradskyella marincola TaxID=3037795 RepID=A0ABT6G1S5_9FLAO|nr:hypothetical protein [Winogradskyella sp. YYF002]MDG4715920.1 hypothetical protein [Winogradskyella sp. YYF002]